MAMSKYRSKKVTVNGETFDSKKEYKRWCELRLLEKAGKIRNLQRQVKFELLPNQYWYLPQVSQKTGKPLKDKKVLIERSASYIADFVYEDEELNTVVEDTKGFRTADYILKRKMMAYFHGIRIREV